MTKTYLSNYDDLKFRRQSLCAYCHGVASPLLYIKDGKHFAACSMDHLQKIGEGEKMEDIKNFAQINQEGLRYALSNSKDKYLEISKKNKTYILHEWDREDRVDFIHKVVANYLNHAKDQARSG